MIVSYALYYKNDLSILKHWNLTICGCCIKINSISLGFWLISTMSVFRQNVTGYVFTSESYFIMYWSWYRSCHYKWQCNRSCTLLLLVGSITVELPFIVACSVELWLTTPHHPSSPACVSPFPSRRDIRPRGLTRGRSRGRCCTWIGMNLILNGSLLTVHKIHNLLLVLYLTSVFPNMYYIYALHFFTKTILLQFH